MQPSTSTYVYPSSSSTSPPLGPFSSLPRSRPPRRPRQGSPLTDSEPSSSSPPKFTRLFGSVLGSPFLTTSDDNVPRDQQLDDLDLVDGAPVAVPHDMTVTRPASPSFSMDFSMISPPSPDPLDSFPSAPTFTRNRGATVSSFFTPSRGRNTIYGSTYGLTHTVGCRPPLISCKSRKTLLPRLWDAISSPGRKSKGKAAAVDQYFLGGGYSYADLQPLDGEEGELIDDEACFIDGTTVTGIGMLRELGYELPRSTC